ncbi:MAG: PqiC family protein [Desulfobacterales bacterium]|nr:PqiC family protein [Desulfobacterales bacterium]
MMRKSLLYKTLWLVPLATLVLTGCGTTPQSQFYTLNSLSNAQTAANSIAPDPSLSIGIGPVVLPEVLDRPQIVIRTGPNKLRIDEFHRWAGRLDEDIARVVAQNISQMLSTEKVAVYPWDVSFKPRYQIIMDIQHFEGRLDQKDVLLEVFWKVIEPQKQTTLRTKRSVIKEPLPAKDYDILMIAKSRVIENLSKLIAKEILSL